MTKALLVIVLVAGCKVQDEHDDHYPLHAEGACQSVAIEWCTSAFDCEEYVPPIGQETIAACEAAIIDQCSVRTEPVPYADWSDCREDIEDQPCSAVISLPGTCVSIWGTP